MTASTSSRLRALVLAFGVIVALLMCGPTAHAATAAPAGDAISIGDPNALGQIDLYVDPLRAIAASNLTAPHQFPEPGVPLVVIDGAPLDGESDWAARLPG